MGVLYKELSDVEERYMLPFIVKEGFSVIKCSLCEQYKLRKATGKTSPNGKRRYYQDELGAGWRGNRCPKCSYKEEQRHVKSYKKRVLDRKRSQGGSTSGPPLGS